MALSSHWTTQQSSQKQTSNYRYNLDRERGILLPESMGFVDGFDAAGHPQRVNLETISNFYHNPANILAVDRLALPEMNRIQPFFPFQRIMAKEIAKRQFLWIQMMRGGSKTSSVARIVLDYCLQNAGVPAIFTGPSFKQALMLLDEVIKIIQTEQKNENSSLSLLAELRGDPKRNALDAIVNLQNGSSLRALPMGDGTKIRGYRGGLIVVDETYLTTEEMYESHIKPFGSVQQGGMPSKIIHTTTSSYQDCFAYKRMMQIVSEVKAGNPAYGFLDFNLQDLVSCGFPLDKLSWQDAKKHGNPTTFAMTYFNIWPRSTSRWYSQTIVDYAISEQHAIGVELERTSENVPYVGVIDLAASDKGDATSMTVFKFVDNKLHLVWAFSGRGLGPSDRAWLVHETDRKFNLQTIVYDAHGAIGVDLRSDLAKKELLVKGVLHKVTPLVHHDANNLSGKHKMIPVAVNDSAVKKALIGPRDGTSIRGEAGLKNILHTKLRDLLTEGSILGCSRVTPIEEGAEWHYTGSEHEVLDTVREAFGQLSGIGLARDKNGNQVYTQDGQLVFETRAGMHDDGAMCIVYAAISLLRLQGYGSEPGRSNPQNKPMHLDGYGIIDPNEVDPNKQIIRIA